MIASRFWFGVVGLVLGASVLALYMAISMHDRLGLRMMSEGLSSDSRVVSWYLNDASRQGASQLIRFAADNQFVRAVSRSNSRGGQPSSSTRIALERALNRVARSIPENEKFDAVLAVNQAGIVVGQVGFREVPKASTFELGGYPLIADALHGHVRDDTLILGRMYRMVARPVGVADGGLPAGVVVGATRVDDQFAAKLSRDTGAAIAFFANGQRQGVGAPDGFDTTGLDQIVSDLETLEGDEDYQQLGRTKVHSLPSGLSAVYAKLPGEAWALGAGYAVVRQAAFLGGVGGLLQRADDKDKREARTGLVAVVTVVAIVVGMILIWWEYNAPLASFRTHVKRVASGASESIAAQTLRGPFRQLALDLNLALDRTRGEIEAPVAFGVPEPAADAGALAAFGLPQPEPPGFAPAAGGGAEPLGGGLAEQPVSPPELPDPEGPQASPGGAPPARRHRDAREAVPAVEEGWAEVYDDFVRLKRECGENVQGFTFERFSSTLRKNRDTLMTQHGVSRVHFSAYIKEGRAALKAKPLRA